MLKYFEPIRTLAVICISLLITLLIISIVSETPIQTIGIFLYEPVSSLTNFGNVIELSIPLMFTGLAMSLLFKMNMFNLGAEGIFYFAGLIAAAVAVYFTLDAFTHPLAAILAGGIVGALISSISGYLKAKWDANELVTSLMLNSILLGVGMYILNYYMRDSSAFQAASQKLQATAKLTRMVEGTRIHTGLIIAVALIIAGHYFMYKTKWGYQLRMTGANREFAEYSGIKTGKVILLVHIIAGFIAGVGGSVEILGMYSRFQWNSLPGYGFDGALVAMLAKNNPLMVIGAALFMAYIRIGADMMSRFADVPAEMISIVQAIILLLVSADHFLKFWKNKMLLKEAKKNV